MFTRDELRSIPLFSRLDDKTLDYLTRTSADIRLLPGEYVVYEGETHRAIFVAVEGNIEATKFVDGTERVIGVRPAGELFGEVPVILDTPFLVSFRAQERARVMRIDLREFRVLSGAAPDIFEFVKTAAMDRVEGLEEIAAEASAPALAVIARQADEDGYELRTFLERNSVAFDWIDADAPAAAPIVRLRDGNLLNNPSIRDVAVAIGLPVRPRDATYDVAIIGGGPAGLAAAVYGASEGLSTILIEQEAPGGQAGTSSRIENYLGFPFGISGDQLASRALQQANRMGAEIIVTRMAQRIDTELHAITLDGGEAVCAKTIVLATGVSWRQLDVPSLDRLRGRGVYYGVAPDEARYVQGNDIYIIGGGNSAGQAAVNFANFANSVTILVRGDSLAGSMSHYLIEQLKTKANVRVQSNSEVVGAHGDDNLEAISIADRKSNETVTAPAHAAFILIGADAETSWLPETIARDARGYIVTGHDARQDGRWPLTRDPYLLETSVPGIFAAGDVRANSIKRVAAGVGEGSMAIAFVHQYLAVRAVGSEH
ncbi:MAG: FAD-dependent oxidoreductase [Candidatus Aquilonibacter sp.]